MTVTDDTPVSWISTRTADDARLTAWHMRVWMLVGRGKMDSKLTSNPLPCTMSAESIAQNFAEAGLPECDVAVIEGVISELKTWNYIITEAPVYLDDNTAGAQLTRAQQRLSRLLLAEARNPQRIAEQAECVRRLELTAADFWRQRRRRRHARRRRRCHRHELRRHHHLG
ncbi:MAG: hypothetical protein ACOC9Q_03650 [bacterium]